jgi:aminoglycoside phosphotransferase (APT) family kinase protein
VSELSLDDLRARATGAVRGRWPAAEIDGIEPLPGGVSSLTFAARLHPEGGSPGRAGSAGPAGPAGSGGDGRRVVIKVAPPGLAPVRNRDVLRQARAIAAVHGAPGVRVPEVLGREASAPPFFVMEFVAGQSYEPKWDVSDAPPTPAVVDGRARAAARMLARLQAIDPAAAGLGDEPALSPADELDRWARLFATAGDDLRTGEAELHRELAARVPAPGPRTAILHGDYRLGNIQFAGPRPAAIIDWEIWSLGDPRHDLAWLMAFCDPGQRRVDTRDAANQAAADAMPSGEALLGEYLDEAGASAPPPDLAWFLALCHYKLGATMTVLAKRNRRATDPDPGLELIAQTTPPMLAAALELLTS